MTTTIMGYSEIVNLVGERVYGRGRGDGYDVEVYAMGARYLASVYDVWHGGVSWYVADGLDAAREVGAEGYTPGSAPGRYRRVLDVSRLREIRDAKARLEASKKAGLP